MLSAQAAAAQQQDPGQSTKSSYAGIPENGPEGPETYMKFRLISPKMGSPAAGVTSLPSPDNKPSPGQSYARTPKVSLARPTRRPGPRLETEFTQKATESARRALFSIVSLDSQASLVEHVGTRLFGGRRVKRRVVFYRLGRLGARLGGVPV